TGDELGCTQRRPRRRWWQFGPRVVDVTELPDSSLLCTSRRCWSLYPWYEVDDADGYLVGWVGGGVLLNTFGNILAFREDDPQPGTSRFHDGERNELGRLAWHGDDVRVEFGDKVTDLPFVKMLLLAAALRWR